jgi:hypothetical protein
MPSITITTADRDRLRAIKASHSLSTYAKAVDHALDDSEATHEPIPMPPLKPSVLKQFVVLAVPSDRLVGSTIKSPSGDYGLSAGIGLAASFGPRMNEWLRQQNAGFQCEWQVLYAPLTQTLEELQTVHPDKPPPERYIQGYRADGTPIVTRDEFGLGFFGTNVLQALGTAEGTFEYAKAALAGKFRLTVWVIGGGAWHGGSHNIGANNTGWSLNGDDDFSPRITGKVDPTSVNTGAGFQTFKATSHEWQHANGMYCHSRDAFDKPDHPADGGPYEPIDSGFTNFPLSWKYDDATGRPWTQAEIDADAGLAHHIAMERKLYDGQRDQARKYSGEWLVAA